MKAEELMIGDWVSFTSRTCSGIGKIVGIEPREGIGVDLGQTFTVSFTDGVKNCVLAGCHSYHVKPIPLTPEILEKNFGKAVGGKFFDGDDYEELYICEVSDSIWLVRCDNVEFSSIPSEQVMVSNVHQLQRTLRLCGIEKEIVL